MMYMGKKCHRLVLVLETVQRVIKGGAHDLSDGLDDSHYDIILAHVEGGLGYMMGNIPHTISGNGKDVPIVNPFIHGRPDRGHHPLLVLGHVFANVKGLVACSIH